MSAMEQSLRRALDAGDPSEPAFRESIYAASERALERMLEAKPLDEASAHAQRVRLAETINRVEAEYYAAFGDPDMPKAGVEESFGEPGLQDAGDGGTVEDAAALDDSGDDPIEPSAGATFLEVAPSVGEAEQPADRPLVDRDGHAGSSTQGPRPGPPGRTKGLRPGALIVLGLALVGLLLAGLFLYATVFPASRSGASVSSDAGAAPEDDWIALFDGRQLSSIATPAGGRVEAVTGAGDRPAVRIESAAEGAEIEVAIGAGAVAGLAGQTVRVELTVGTPDGRPREFGVRCLLGGETRCGRQRFTATQASEAFVLDMAVPDGAREAGSISFDPGIGGPSKALDLYAVRARVAAPV